ncbi:MAG TPA: RDD family protein, partial [Acidimicrobiales bacterium]|nr:RDD family protein [Acidimicrobiales bacterium]
MPTGRRFAASAIDLPFAAGAALVLIFGFQLGMFAMPAIFVLLTLASWGGRSPGMRLTDLTVVDAASGTPIGVTRAAARALAQLVALVITFWLTCVIAIALFGAIATFVLGSGRLERDLTPIVVPVAATVLLATTGLDAVVARRTGSAPWDVLTRT